MADDKSLKHDALVARIVGDPAKPADTVWLTGFLGPSSEAGHTRVYSDPSFETYVDVPTDAIIHTEPLPKDQSPLGGSYVWLKKDAEVLHGKVGTERTKAKFLEGPIQQAFAGQAAAPAPGAGVGILPTDNPGCGPTRFLPLCHSPNLPGCQSPLPFCNSAIDACPTRIPQFCHTHFPANCPTHYPALCPSILVPCPTQHPHPCPSFAPSPCPPSPPPLLCPHTQWPQHCITLPFCPTETGCPTPFPHCFQPPITVNNQQCVASGGGPGCPVLPGTPVETPQVHPGVAPAQAFAAGPGGAPQPPTLAPGCHVSGVNACVTGIGCQTPAWQCPIPPSHVGCFSFPIQCFTPHCPPTPLHGPCQSVGLFCLTPPFPEFVPSLAPNHCLSQQPLCLFTPPPSHAPQFCFTPLRQCQVHTPFCPVSPPCPVSPLCPQTVNCPISPNCPPATGGCPFGPGGGGGPQF